MSTDSGASPRVRSEVPGATRLILTDTPQSEVERGYFDWLTADPARVDRLANSTRNEVGRAAFLAGAAWGFHDAVQEMRKAVASGTLPKATKKEAPG